MLFRCGRDPANCPLAEPACPIAGDQIIHGIAQGCGNQAEDCREREREPEQAQHAQNRVGTKQDPFVVDDNDGADPGSGKTAFERKGCSGFGLARGEAKDIFAIKAQQEVNPAVTKAALSVKHDYRVCWHGLYCLKGPTAGEPGSYHNIIMAVTSAVLSVGEFARLPLPAGGVRQELHHGELVEWPPVRKLHTKLQKRLVSLLEARLIPAEYGVDKEFPFRPAPEYEVWVADVALFSLALWEQTEDDDYFCGVPAIVIEVLSPSNTASETLEREEICLRQGGREFWLVDPQRESVKVIRADGYSNVCDSTAAVESRALGGSIPVHDIFAH